MDRKSTDGEKLMGLVVLICGVSLAVNCLSDKWKSYKSSVQQEIHVSQITNPDQTIDRYIQKGEERFYSVIGGNVVKSKYQTTQPTLEQIPTTQP